MLAFEVSINGKRRYLAGHTDAQRLILFLSSDCYARDGNVTTSMVVPHDNPGGSATLSYETDQVPIGGEITIRVVDVEKPDPPVKRNDGQGGYRIVASAS
jgi:hypothetical protein